MHCDFNILKAAATLRGGEKAPSLYGKVSFFQRKDGVLVVADISGLPKNSSGFYGFHIHEGALCDGEDFSGSGIHYNPDSKPHPLHAGDMPPLIASGGKAYLQFLTDRFKVSDTLGRTVIIHDSPDDFTTQPSGSAGTKIACGIIYKK